MLQNCWYVAGWCSDISRDEPFAIRIIGKPVVIYRGEDSELIAMEDRCCHKQAKLSVGRIEGSCLRCMYHGLLFDAEGKCIEIPGQDKIPAKAKIRSYPVKEFGSWVWVWMGDPEKADPALIPPVRGFEDDDFDLRGSHMDYDANYELINDNLTDFSHLSFVHPASFGSSSHWAEVRPKVERLDRGIRISRWITGGSEENKNVSGAVGRTSEAPCTYISYTYLVPGVLLMRSETYKLEDYPEDGESEPTGIPVSTNTTCQVVTPMSEDQTRYFFVTGPMRSENSGPVAEKFLEVTKIAFEEDRAMIESQAENLKWVNRPTINTSADLGPMQFRQILRSLMKDEEARAV